MYYVEKRINGILHYKNSPTGKWYPVLPSRLNEKLLETENKYKEVCEELYQLKLVRIEFKRKIEEITKEWEKYND